MDEKGCYILGIKEPTGQPQISVQFMIYSCKFGFALTYALLGKILLKDQAHVNMLTLSMSNISFWVKYC